MPNHKITEVVVAHRGSSTARKRGPIPYVILSAAQIAQLGKVPDWHIAAECGCNRATIQRMRRELGVDSHNRAMKLAPEHVKLLGILNDRRIAIMVGCSHSTIRGIRAKLGIQPANYKRYCNNEAREMAAKLVAQRAAMKYRAKNPDIRKARKEAADLQEGLQQFAALAEKLQANTMQL